MHGSYSNLDHTPVNMMIGNQDNDGRSGAILIQMPVLNHLYKRLQVMGITLQYTVTIRNKKIPEQPEGQISYS